MKFRDFFDKHNLGRLITRYFSEFLRNEMTVYLQQILYLHKIHIIQYKIASVPGKFSKYMRPWVTVSISKTFFKMQIFYMIMKYFL